MLRLSARSATGAVVAATAVLALVPGAASAKTFSAHWTDPSGDAKSAVDIVSARIAYNRKTGALSGAVTVSGSIDTSSNATVAIGLSDLVNGKCYKPLLMAGAVFSHPDVSFGDRLTATGGVVGKIHFGTASQTDNAMSFRVKDKSLSGKTVGCAVALVMNIPTDGSKPTILDETDANNGFV